MNNKMKKIFALMIASALTLASFTGAFAAETEEVPAEETAVTETVAEETEAESTEAAEKAEEKPVEEVAEETEEKPVGEPTDETGEEPVAETEPQEPEEPTEDPEKTADEVVFLDMPDNWTTQALKNAVKNGLLFGEETAEGMMVKPDDNITRAQMAAIIVRAFGATQTADISRYPDVDQNAWYYTELSKAVAMNAFQGDGKNMNPNKNITFQECFTVISQVMFMSYDDKTCLDVFSDRAEIAEWAVPYAAAIVGNGYWDGIDGKLLPTTYITRSQFAVLMDNLIQIYITEPGTYSEFDKGTVMVKSDEVIISGTKIQGGLIVGDAVSGTGFTLVDTYVDGILTVRGGGHNVHITENSSVGRTHLVTPELTVTFDGTSESRNGGWTCHKTDKVKLGGILQ